MTLYGITNFYESLVYAMGERSGIKSLELRLKRLETVSKPINSDPLSTLVNELKQKETDIKKMQMDAILDHYVTDLSKTFKEGTSEIDLIKIVIFTCKYIENNSLSVSKTLGVKTCSTFKQSLCRTFIKHVYNDTFPDKLIDTCIDEIIKLIFPKVIESVIPEKHEKKGFFKRT